MTTTITTSRYRISPAYRYPTETAEAMAFALLRPEPLDSRLEPQADIGGYIARLDNGEEMNARCYFAATRPMLRLAELRKPVKMIRFGWRSLLIGDIAITITDEMLSTLNGRHPRAYPPCDAYLALAVINRR